MPPQRERESGPAPAPDWAPLFAEARLDPSQFRPVEPRWTPPLYSDARAAWEGSWPRRPEITLRVEAAAYRGRPVWFEIVNPWTRPEREQVFPFTPGQRGMQAFFVLVMVALVAIGGLLAYRNIRLGRGDRRGAFRLALVLATLAVASWALRAHHVPEPGGELVLFARGAGIAVLVAALLWLFYLALEPYVRRLRPWTLVSWARLLEGGARDAVVGRDVLIGLAWGTVLALLGVVGRALVVWLGRPEPPPEALRGRRAPLDAPAPELRRRSSGERDPRRAGSPAALPRPEARDPPGPGRRRSRRGVPGRRATWPARRRTPGCCCPSPSRPGAPSSR